MITENVFLGRDNENELIIDMVDENGQTAAADFGGVTRMVLSFRGSDATVDSATNPEMISWTADGHIALHLGTLDIIPSKYMATLVAYDPLHDDGQVLFHAYEEIIQFWFMPL